MRFTLAADRPELFSAKPALAADGTLFYTPAVGAGGGTAVVKVRAEDDGGVERGGIDRSAERSFRINIAVVNTPPSFALAATALALDEDFAVAQSVTVAPAPVPAAEQGQRVVYRVSPAALSFANLVIDPASGALTLSAVPDASGSAVLTLVADDGQARNNIATQTLSVTVRQVNDPPMLGALRDLTNSASGEPPALDLFGSVYLPLARR